MILVIDNYDSFTFNVVQAVQVATEEEIKVVRNDEFKLEDDDEFGMIKELEELLLDVLNSKHP